MAAQEPEVLRLQENGLCPALAACVPHIPIKE